jgi:hypothetical protein
LTGDGKSVDGSSPLDARPGGKGWTVKFVQIDDKNKPFLSIDLTSPKYPSTKLRTVTVDGNVKTIYIEYLPPGSETFKVLQPEGNFAVTETPEFVLKDPVTAVRLRIVLVEPKDNSGQFKNIKVSLHVCDGKFLSFS